MLRQEVANNFFLQFFSLLQWIVYKNKYNLREAIKGTSSLFCYYLVCGISIVWAIVPSYAIVIPKFLELLFAYLAIALVMYKIQDRERALLYVLYLVSISAFLGVFNSFFTLDFHTNSHSLSALVGVILSLGLIKYYNYSPARWFLYFDLFV